MSADNKAIIRRLYEEVFNKGNLALVEELFSPTYVRHDTAIPELRGTSGAKQICTMIRTAFPDLHCTLEEYDSRRRQGSTPLVGACHASRGFCRSGWNGQAGNDERHRDLVGSGGKAAGRVGTLGCFGPTATGRSDYRIARASLLPCLIGGPQANYHTVGVTEATRFESAGATVMGMAPAPE